MVTSKSHKMKSIVQLPQHPLAARKKSFVYAWEGIVYMFRKEANARIHLASSIIVVALGFLFKISATEFLLMIVLISIVLVAEIFNTAIEKAMDHFSPAIHPKVKIVKDLAAGGVLIAAMAALIAGCIIFIPKILFHV